MKRIAVRREGRRIAAAAAALALAAGAARAGEDGFLHPPRPSSPPLTSPSQRFVFRGFDPRDSLDLARWAERVTVAVEREMGAGVPFRRAEMIRFIAVEGQPDAPAEVMVGQGYLEQLLQQQVVVVNPQGSDAEMMLHQFVRLLVYRYVLAFRPGPSDRAPDLPDWLVIGLAQRVEPGLRQRNRDFVFGEWQQGGSLPLADLFAFQRLPPERADARAWCGAAAEWLGEILPRTVGWGGLFKRLADGRELDSDWLVATALGLASAREAEQVWDLWLAAQSGSRLRLGGADPAQLDALRVLLDMDPLDYNVVPAADAPRRLRPEDVLERHGERWVQDLALRVAVRVEHLAVGQAPEVQEVAELYRGFFAAVADGASAGLLGPAAGTEAARGLKARLDVATARLDELGRQLAGRAGVLEAIAARGAPDAGPAPPAADTEPDIEERRRRFLDAIEGLP